MARGNRRQASRSRVAFRPSSLAIGLEPVQPYTPVWPEGSEYGASWIDYWTKNGIIGGLKEAAGVTLDTVQSGEVNKVLAESPAYPAAVQVLDRLLAVLPGVESEAEKAEREAEEEEKRSKEFRDKVLIGSVVALSALIVAGHIYSKRRDQ